MKKMLSIHCHKFRYYMKNLPHTWLFPVFSLFLSCNFLQLSGQGDNTAITNKGQIIHVQKVYKEIDTFMLKMDIFFTEQSLKKTNNTVIHQISAQFDIYIQRVVQSCTTRFY